MFCPVADPIAHGAAEPWFQSTTKGRAMSGTPSAKFGGNATRTGDLPQRVPASWPCRDARPAFSQEGFVRFVRAAFPASPAQHLAHLVGCPSSTAEKWLRREGAPSAQYLGAMIGLFGPAFVAAAIEPAPPWAARAANDQRRAELTRALEELNT
jgi:hypothetical protein